jgi:hypothetical protein
MGRYWLSFAPRTFLYFLPEIVGGAAALLFFLLLVANDAGEERLVPGIH